MAEVPPELINEILLRLPVKSIKRCRCLSKSLCAAIDSPDFINSHLTRSSLNFNFRKLIFPDGFGKKFSVFDLNLDQLDLEPEVLSQSNLREKSFGDGEGLVQKSVYEREFGSDRPWHGIFGYCNGLLLLHTGNSGLALWNPSTREYRDLPDCPCQVPRDTKVYSFFRWGLGFDSSSDDYKVFLMVPVTLGSHRSEFQVWIYGLKSNIWRRAQNFTNAGVVIRRGSEFGYFSDGSLHFPCFDWKSDIMTFDLINETFAIMAQPDCPIKSMGGLYTKLHLLEGCLCMSYYSSSIPRQADLYIRKKDRNDKFRWTQLFSVKEPFPFDISWPVFAALEPRWFDYFNVLGYSKRGDKILLDFGSRMPCMVSYDLKQKRFGKVEMDKGRNWGIPILCLESLVSVSGGDFS